MVFFTRRVQVLMERDSVGVWVFRVKGIDSSVDVNVSPVPEWPNTVWRTGINSLHFSMHTKSRFCICCNAETFVGAKLRGRNNCS